MALPGCLLPFQEHSALPYRRGEIQIYAPTAPGVFFELMKNESSRQGSRLHPPNHLSQVSFLLRLLHASPLSKIVLISSRDLQEKAYTMFNSEFLLWYLYFYRYWYFWVLYTMVVVAVLFFFVSRKEIELRVSDYFSWGERRGGLLKELQNSSIKSYVRRYVLFWNYFHSTDISVFHIFGTPCVSKLICNGYDYDQVKDFYGFLCNVLRCSLIYIC